MGIDSIIFGPFKNLLEKGSLSQNLPFTTIKRALTSHPLTTKIVCVDDFSRSRRILLLIM